jgi:mRNA-degrading endonuclease RelE of RelBE toxin-antitoxin system
MPYQVRVHKYLTKDLLDLPPAHRKEADRFLREVLPIDPHPDGHEKIPLQGRFKGWVKIRLGEYRLVYTIQEREICVLALFAAPRGQVYNRLRAFLRR